MVINISVYRLTCTFNTCIILSLKNISLKHVFDFVYTRMSMSEKYKSIKKGAKNHTTFLKKYKTKNK